MKALIHIMVSAMFLASSCATSGLHTGGENDDLYYSASDKAVITSPVTKYVSPGNLQNQQKPQNQQIQQNQQNQQSNQYFDNKYAADTLFADNYSDQVDINNSLYYNKDNSPFEYANDWTASNSHNRYYDYYPGY